MLFLHAYLYSVAELGPCIDCAARTLQIITGGTLFRPCFQLSLALPLMALYELSIWGGRLAGKARTERHADVQEP